jgi:hypothetical protein
MPSFIPYSFSSPFYKGKDFEGLCSRSYSRSGARQLTDLSVRRGVVVLEFRGFDACGDAMLLSALLSLFRGFLLDETLTGSLQNQDPERVKRSSIYGFDDPSIRKQGMAVLSAAKNALGEEANTLHHLEALLDNKARLEKRTLIDDPLLFQKAKISGLQRPSIADWDARRRLSQPY